MPDVFARTPQREQDTVSALVEMLRTIELSPQLLLEVVLQGPFEWRRRVRKTSVRFLQVDDSVLNLCFKRLEDILDVTLHERAKNIAAVRGGDLSWQKALDLAVQELGTDLQEKETERKEEDALFEAAAAPRPGLTLAQEAELLPAYPDNAGMATDKAKL